MTIGLPIPFSYQSSNVVDTTETLTDKIYGCAPLKLEKGMTVRGDNWIWRYDGDEYIVPPYNEATGNKKETAYEVGQLLMKDCKLVRVTGRDGTGFYEIKVPKNPENYSAWDTDTSGRLNFNRFKHRYFRVSAAQKDGWLNKMWRGPDNERWYYMFWEARGNGGCGRGAWRWSAKDITATGCRNFQMYLRSCLANGYSSKYEPAKDIKATIHNWAAPTSDGGRVRTIQFHSMIERNGYFYFRTHLNIAPELKDLTVGTEVSYSFEEVLSPSEIDGFTKVELVSSHRPFDGKSYTSCVDVPPTGKSIWTMLAAAPFDSIAVGRVIADSISIRIMNPEGDILDELTNYTVQNTVAPNSEVEYPATVVLYTKRDANGKSMLIPSESVVEITLKGDRTQVGEIMAAETLDAGFTKVQFKNKMKDFSPKEQDQWGNWEYKSGVRVSVHSGTVEFPIVSYDELNRLMLMIGGQKVVINSSDTLLNQSPDGRNVFEATMMIARFLTFELSSSEKNKRIGERGLYTFNIEELV